jgi:hypothetical protein
MLYSSSLFMLSLPALNPFTARASLWPKRVCRTDPIARTYRSIRYAISSFSDPFSCPSPLILPRLLSLDLRPDLASVRILALINFL